MYFLTMSVWLFQEFPVGVYEKTISIQILDDDSPEQDETFTITLTTPGFVLGLSCPSEPCVLGMEVGDPSAVTVTIEDNEPVRKLSSAVFYD